MNLNMKDMLEQAQKFQQQMNKIKQEVDAKTVTEETGGGMVKITVTGANRVINLKIAREIVNPDDIEMLEDLVVAAVNKAIESASKMAEEEMKKVTGFLPNIPGLNLNM